MYKDVIDQKMFAEKVRQAQDPFSEYKYPSTKEEYWAIVDKYWSHLLNIILQMGPDYVTLDDETVKLAIAATRLKEQHSTTLVKYFQNTWAAAPDTGYIHAIPAWHILCDLCSESYLAYE